MNEPNETAVMTKGAQSHKNADEMDKYEVRFKKSISLVRILPMMSRKDNSHP
jgi:hypothetical protein